ncbi:GWT1-domain-containing protein [Auricularia subglabra TFB-10046 SS5]|nr:GWT1-domain-containing protein [Auricularia subglabra TFB-10046 SS5]
MASHDYKAAKEAFVSGVVGSSITQINLISLVSFISLGIHGDVVRRRAQPPVSFALEWVILALPILLSITVFAERPLLLVVLTLAAQWPLSFAVSRLYPSSPHSNASTPTAHAKSNTLAALTAYRSHMMLLTALAILAVDFPVFPRFLAKCETFGTSIMDIGVGAFVFSQGVVSAAPILKNPTYLDEPLLRKLTIVIRKVMPLALLGIIRVLLVKGTDYPEHVTEYGVHWNFFITLAILPPLQVLLHGLIARINVGFLAVTIAGLHQLALSYTPLQNYALNAARTDWLSMNKEGIISLPGYLAIHLLGLTTGLLVIPSSPSYFRRMRKQLRLNAENSEAARPLPKFDGQRDNGKTATELFSYSVVWWVLVGLIVLMRGNQSVSRRLANLPYVLWTAAYNTSAILIYILLEILQKQETPAPVRDDTKDADLIVPPPTRPAQAPVLLEAINRNGLLFFLLANLCTGVVNLSIRTMYAGTTLAMVVLSSYSVAICYVAWISRGRRLINL